MKTLLAVLFCVMKLYATTLSGTVQAPDGTGVNGVMILTISQQASRPAGACGGPAVVASSYQVRITLTAGALSGSASVIGNDCLLPQGTYYNVKVIDSRANVLLSDHWLITGSSVNVGTIVSTVVSGTTTSLGSPGVVITNPVGQQQVVQPAGMPLSVNLLRVTGTLTLPSGLTCDTSGCTVFGGGTNILTTNTSQTISGVKTFGASLLAQSGSANIGGTTNYFQDAVFNGQVTAGRLRLNLGTPDAPTDFFTIANGAIHSLQIHNSSGESVLTLDDDQDYQTYWTMKGSIVPTSTSANIGTLGTADYPWRRIYLGEGVALPTNNFGTCASLPDGIYGFRTASSTMLLCVGGVLKTLVYQ